MRLSKLYLKAFGPYTEQVIDFAGTDASLHIICGPNEAGKSSLLRAVRGLFFGISERTLDNFLHENAVLRIAGIVKDDTGHQLFAMRRKARKQPLREWNGNVGTDIVCESEPLPDGAISALMGNIGEAQFSKLFGIDRDELIKGGEAILDGQGDVGESLFEAGAGLVGLRRLRDALESEAGLLFAPRASKPLINSTINEYETARHQAKDLAIKTEEWVRREEAFTAALQQLNENKHALAELRMENEGPGFIYLPLLNYADGNLDFVKGLLERDDAVISLSDGGAHCGTIPIELAIKRQCRDTALLYGMDDRGLLKPGYLADVNVIDMKKLKLCKPWQAFDLPAGGKRLLQKADGYVVTIKSGQVTFRNGEVQSVRPGVVIRGPQRAPMAMAAE